MPCRRHFLAAVAGAAAVSTLRADETSKLGQTPHTKFAVNIEMWWRRVTPFHQRIVETAKLGFPAVEFWPWRNKDLEAIARTCKEHNVQVAQFTAWGFTPGLNDPANHEKFVQEIESACEAAKKLNCSLLTVVGGNDRPGVSQADMHQAIIDGLKKVAPLVEKQGITLILEPMNIRVDHKGHCLYGSEAGVKIVRAVGSPNVKVLFDLYHNQITEGDLCGRLRDGIKELGYVQIADHPGRNEPGTGEIHYPRVLQELQTLGYKGFVGLECRPKKDELTAAKAVQRADQW